MTEKRGYFQLELDGETYTGHISMTCLYLLTQMRGIGFEQIGEVLSNTTDPKNFSDIVFCAIKANALKEKVEPPFSNDWEFMNLMAENQVFSNTEFITSFTTATLEAKVFKNDENLGIPRKVKKSTKNPK